MVDIRGFSLKNQLRRSPRLGNDGPWSTFRLGYGTPPQPIHSLISTSIPQPYVILPQGCISTDPSNCPGARGTTFNFNVSSTWQNLGPFPLAFEQNLGIYENGNFAFETVSLGSNVPTLDYQMVVGIATKAFFLGMLGLRPAPTNLTNLNDPIPSLMQNLKSGGHIPSLSWAYTAGSYYHSPGNLNSSGMGTQANAGREQEGSS